MNQGVCINMLIVTSFGGENVANSPVVHQEGNG
jgi:hypothetical protein